MRCKSNGRNSIIRSQQNLITIINCSAFSFGRVHRPISLSLGLLSVSAGCILFFIPQFTTPAYRPEGGAYNPLCSSNRSSSCDDNSESLSYYLPVFVIARLLIGMGATPIITVGVNYMDDCSTKEKFAKYCGKLTVKESRLTARMYSVFLTACEKLIT
jgi:MFS family permease